MSPKTPNSTINQEQTLLLVQILNEIGKMSLKLFVKQVQNKTKLATTCSILRPFYLELQCKTMRDFHSVVCRPFLVAQVLSVAIFEHSIL